MFKLYFEMNPVFNSLNLRLRIMTIFFHIEKTSA